MTNKHELKMKQLQKYKIMDTATKQNLQDKKADQHKTMDTAKKEEHSYCCSKKTLDSCVEQYKKKIRESPCYICFWAWTMQSEYMIKCRLLIHDIIYKKTIPKGCDWCKISKCYDIIVQKYVLKLNPSSYPYEDVLKYNHHIMENNMSARPVTQKPYKEQFHVRQS
ncbi:hypothetical protein pdam_00005517 [Pocillopora damicornis]|uniref:Uncharacterized protein n=1 Tax=Pocillopora damicornis TaxID=46731 RepID=A0A3M6TAI6_POCDA|nr:hypothetical protein pdam_00005517 [Pocillopora damicornis]